MTDKFDFEKFTKDLFQLTRQLRDHKVADELSHLQIHTLFFIQMQNRCTLSKLAENFGVTLPTASKLIDRLFNQKLVERSEDPADRRNVLLAVTPAGDTKLKETKNKRYLELKRTLSILEESDLLHLQKILSKLVLNEEKNA